MKDKMVPKRLIFTGVLLIVAGLLGGCGVRCPGGERGHHHYGWSTMAASSGPHNTSMAQQPVQTQPGGLSFS